VAAEPGTATGSDRLKSIAGDAFQLPSTATNFRALEPDFNPKHFLGSASYFAGRELNVIRDFNPVDVHAGVIVQVPARLRPCLDTVTF